MSTKSNSGGTLNNLRVDATTGAIYTSTSTTGGTEISPTTATSTASVVSTASTTTSTDTIVVEGSGSGRGISSITISNNGHLFITYTDGGVEDAGSVGTGFVSAVVDANGHLILTKSDQTVIDVGLVKGTDVFSKTVSAGTTIMGGVRIGDNGNAAKIPVFRNPTPTDIMPFSVLTASRSLTELVRDHGEALENCVSQNSPFDHYGAFYRLTLYDKRRIILGKPTYQFRAGVSDHLVNRVIVASATGGGSAVPTISFENSDGSMWSFGTDSRDVRFEGHHIWEYRDAPLATTGVAALKFLGGKNIYIEELTLRNAPFGLRFLEGTSNVYIGRLNLPTGSLIRSDNSVSNIRIGTLTGGDTSGISSGADFQIGVTLPSLVKSIGLLTPIANKVVTVNSSTVAALSDWIGDTAWYPTVTCANPGDFVFTGTTSGSYSKHGKTLTLDYIVSGKPTYTTATGALQIGNLPYVTSGGTVSSMSPPSSMPKWTWTTGDTAFYAGSVPNLNYLQFYTVSSGAAYTAVPISIWPSGTTYALRGRIVLRTAA